MTTKDKDIINWTDDKKMIKSSQTGQRKNDKSGHNFFWKVDMTTPCWYFVNRHLPSPYMSGNH